MSCSCHINPPCSYCMAKEECVGCGELIHPDDSFEIQKAADDAYGPLCKKCYDAEHKDAPNEVTKPPKRMMRAFFTGYNLTEMHDYEIKFEYDTVYEVICDEGKIFCRPKGFFYEIPPELENYCDYCELQDVPFTIHCPGCENLKCDEAMQAYKDAMHDEVTQEYLKSVKEADEKNERVVEKKDSAT